MPTSTPPSPESLKALLVQITQDSIEHTLSRTDLEAIWSMGLSSYLTAREFGIVHSPQEWN